MQQDDCSVILQISLILFVRLLRRVSTLSLFFRLDAGTGTSVAKSKAPVSLHKWHKIRLERNSKDMSLYVDDQSVVKVANKGSFTKINLQEIMYVGTVYTEDKSLPER